MAIYAVVPARSAWPVLLCAKRPTLAAHLRRTTLLVAVANGMVYPSRRAISRMKRPGPLATGVTLYPTPLYSTRRCTQRTVVLNAPTAIDSMRLSGCACSASLPDQAAHTFSDAPRYIESLSRFHPSNVLKNKVSRITPGNDVFVQDRAVSRHSALFGVMVNTCFQHCDDVACLFQCSPLHGQVALQELLAAENQQQATTGTGNDGQPPERKQPVR
jgi:hypothetical protein